MLFKVNKLHPDVLDDEMLAVELEYLKEYVKNMKIGDREEQKDTPVEANTAKPELVMNPPTKAKRAPRKAKAVVQADPMVEKPLFTFDTAQFQGVLPTANNTQPPQTVEMAPAAQPIIPKARKQAPASAEVTSCQCMARVISSAKGAMSYDYMSYPNNSTTPVYGRRCKNVQIANSQFCIVHSKKCEYGIFTEEASEAVKASCLKKYTRLKEIEDRHQPSSD
jgi:hypothetical protein